MNISRCLRHHGTVLAMRCAFGVVGLFLLSATTPVWADRIQNDKSTPYGPEDLYIGKAKDMLQRGEWRFDDDAAGQAPKGFSEVSVGGNGAGSWVVASGDQALSAPNLLKQVKPCGGEGCFHILQADHADYNFVDIIFRIRPLQDQTSGIGGGVFSVKDSKNFYAVLVDFSKDQLSLIRVLNGEESVLGTSPITRKGQGWHSIRAQRNTNLTSEYIETYFDHKMAVSVQDQSLGVGGVGLVTRGAAPIGFDNLKTIRIYSQDTLSSPAAY